MQLAAQIAALIAALSTGVVYGTDAFCALVQRPALARWQSDGSTETMHEQLRERVRLVAGRNRLPTAAIIGSQSVKAAEEVARTGRGCEAGKKVNGRKRHIAVDVMGMLLTVLVTAASVQDRDAARPLLRDLRQACSSSPSRSSSGPMTCTPSKCCPVGG
jgi:transposase